jgi:hypothetical protein
VGMLCACVCMCSSTHRRKHTASLSTPNLKWATFTYTGKETTYITNIFKHSNIGIAFRTKHSILSHLTNHTHTYRNQYSSSGVYKLTCPDCNKAYISQTDLTNTSKPSATTVPHQTLPNISMNTTTPSALSA